MRAWRWFFPLGTTQEEIEEITTLTQPLPSPDRRHRELEEKVEEAQLLIAEMQAMLDEEDDEEEQYTEPSKAAAKQASAAGAPEPVVTQQEETGLVPTGLTWNKGSEVYEVYKRANATASYFIKKTEAKKKQQKKILSPDGSWIEIEPRFLELDGHGFPNRMELLKRLNKGTQSQLPQEKEEDDCRLFDSDTEEALEEWGQTDQEFTQLPNEFLVDTHFIETMERLAKEHEQQMSVWPHMHEKDFETFLYDGLIQLSIERIVDKARRRPNAPPISRPEAIGNGSLKQSVDDLSDPESGFESLPSEFSFARITTEGEEDLSFELSSESVGSDGDSWDDDEPEQQPHSEEQSDDYDDFFDSDTDDFTHKLTTPKLTLHQDHSEHW